MQQKYIITILTVLIMFSLVGNLLKGFLDSLSWLVLFTAIGVVAAGILLMYFFVFHHNPQRNVGNTFYQQFSRVNEILRDIPSGEGIIWRGGSWTGTQVYVVDIGGEKKWLRSFYGRLENSHYEVLVIYNITDDAIFCTYPYVAEELRKDHFHYIRKNFSKGPSLDERMMESRRRRRSPRSVSIPLMEDGEDQPGELEPAEDTVRKIDQMKGGQNNE